MGADFVLARTDPTLGTETYVGIIAKCDDVRQDHADVTRQIEECAVERHFDGGKKKIFLSEIWIVTSGTITAAAERKVHESHRSSKVQFVDRDRLAILVDKFAPHFWSDIAPELGMHLAAIEQICSKANTTSFLMPLDPSTDWIEQKLRPIVPVSARKISMPKGTKRTSLEEVLASKDRFIMIEGAMGSGKSAMFRRAALNMCVPNSFSEFRMVPAFFHVKELSASPQAFLEERLVELCKLLPENKGGSVVIFIDGMDEIDASSAQRVDTVSKCVEVGSKWPHVKLLFGSRPIWTLTEEQQLEGLVQRFAIAPLEVAQIYRFIKKVCATMGLSERLQENLQTSALFRVMPRTPLCATLLAKVISADKNELPQSLPELYSKYCELSLGRWDEAKGLSAEQEYPIRAELVTKLAAYVIDHELDFVGTAEVLSQFSAYLGKRKVKLTAEAALAQLSERSDLFQIDELNQTLRFRHRTFCEYFYANGLREEYGKAAPFHNPFEGYWMGVEYFYLGLLGDASSRVDRLSKLPLNSERERLLKLIITQSTK